MRGSIVVSLVFSSLSFISIPATAVDTCTPKVIENGGYITLQFLDTGTCTYSTPAGTTVMQGLIVAGGGGGGTDIGGGGGGGGYIDFETLTVSSQTLTITVGTGGAGAAPTPGADASPGESGGNSIISGTGLLLTSLGGAGGASLFLSNASPARGGGGSGGGSSGGNGAGGADLSSGESQTVQLQTVQSQTSTSLASIGGRQLGNKGSRQSINADWVPGGGGGAGSEGALNTSNGGDGYLNSILGTTYYWAGGGGGGGTSTVAGNGGAGGGGAGGGLAGVPGNGGAGLNPGSVNPNGNFGGNGGANTGGGGGGSTWSEWNSRYYSGGNGGSGIVVLKYAAPPLGVAAKLDLTRAPAGTTRKGAFGTQPIFTIRDSAYNTDTTSNAVVTASVSGGGTLVGTATATASAGVVTFVNLGVEGNIGSTYTVNFSSPGLPSTSTTVTLTGAICSGESFSCIRGDISPSSGIIFYAPNEPFYCGADFTSLCTYLEAAPKNWKAGGVNDPTHYFKAAGIIVDGVNQDNIPVPGILHDTRDGGPNMSATQIGLGYKNSIVLSAFDTSTGNGAVASRGYNGGGKSDWYLPTLAELRLLCQFSHGQNPDIGTACDYTNPLNTEVPSAYAFLSTAYISSSGSLYNWQQNFVVNAYGPGEHNDYGYNNSAFATRPIRAFAATVTSSKIAVTRAPIGPERTKAFTTQPQITIQSANGVRDLSASDTVTATVSAGATLVGTTTATAIQGRATFSNLGIDGTVGTAYTLTFTVAGFTVATTTVTPTPRVISVAAIGGVTAPVSGATPVSVVTAANGYTGTVTWSGGPSTFAPSTGYTATITLTAASGNTLSGVTADFFTVAGATSVTHNANSGVITAVFPVTAIAAPAFSISRSSETVTVNTALNGYTITSTGGAVANYSISPDITINTPGLSFDAATGLISGTPTNVASSLTYTITASNATTPDATRTFAITVVPPPPSVAIGTTSFTSGVASNLSVTLSDFDSSQSYQVTVKFVNASTNVEVSNGTLVATQGATSLISGYTAYSGAKLGFKGTYSSIATALSTLTWNPTSSTNGISIRIGISSAPSTNDFYDANSSHYYRFVSTKKSWSNARNDAESTYLYGLRGYLAEINTEAENSYIAKETSAKNIWIGAREDSATALSYRVAYSYNGSAGQRWIWDGAEQSPLPVGTGLTAQGPPAAYSSWAPTGEPNNDSKPGPDCAVTNWGKNGFWNDLPCRNGYGYLIEFGGRPNEVSTASAATLTETVTAADPIQYTITYNPNSGNSTPTQVSRTTGQRFNLANAITRTPSGGISYQFAGWESNSNTYAAGETITVESANLTFTAAWIQLYEVTYISNGGTFAGSETSKDSECASDVCSINQPITLNSPPTRSGYTFNGWEDQNGDLVTDSNSGTSGTQTTVTSTNYIFTASWTIISYSVTYVSSGSNAPTQNPLNTQETFTVGGDPTKAGHRFDGWNDGTQIYWEDDLYLIGTSDVTLTAEWTPVYSVTYSVGAGTGTPPDGSAIYLQGSTFEVASSDGLSRAGFNFGGWSDGSVTVQPTAAYLVGTTNVLLTAQWLSSTAATKSNTASTMTVTVWNITFDKNGADSGNVPSALKVYEDQKSKVTLPGNIGRTTSALNNLRPMYKKGYTFIGWSTDKNGATPLPTLFTPTSSATLYAIWEATSIATPTPKPSPTATPNTQVTNQMVKVGTFYMTSGSYFLNDATKKSLSSLAQKINAGGSKSILVYGHADNRGGVNNSVLSQNRAKAVAAFIRPLLTSKKISIGWFSSKKPVKAGSTPADLALNRRVEIYTN